MLGDLPNSHRKLMSTNSRYSRNNRNRYSSDNPIFPYQGALLKPFLRFEKNWRIACQPFMPNFLTMTSSFLYVLFIEPKESGQETLPVLCFPLLSGGECRNRCQIYSFFITRHIQIVPIFVGNFNQMERSLKWPSKEME